MYELLLDPPPPPPPPPPNVRLNFFLLEQKELDKIQLETITNVESSIFLPPITQSLSNFISAYNVVRRILNENLTACSL